MIDEDLRGTTTLGQSGSGSNSNDSILSGTLELNPHHQTIFSVISRIPLFGGGRLTTMQKMQSAYSMTRQQDYVFFIYIYTYIHPCLYMSPSCHAVSMDFPDSESGNLKIMKERLWELQNINLTSWFQFSVIPKTHLFLFFWGSYPSAKNTDNLF